MCPAKGEVWSVFRESVTSLGAGCGQKPHDKITYLWDPVVHVPPPAGAPQGSVSQDLVMVMGVVMARSQGNERGGMRIKVAVTVQTGSYVQRR